MGRQVFKLNEIPTKNKVIIIDDYSPNYNYIVEDDKIYYSRKGRNDYWVDISDNEAARQNLLNFLHDNYNFKGYEDREKEIYNLVKEGKFDRNTFGVKQLDEPFKWPDTPERDAWQYWQEKRLPQWKLKSKPRKSDGEIFMEALRNELDKHPTVKKYTGVSIDNKGNITWTNPITVDRIRNKLTVQNPGDIGNIWNTVINGDLDLAYKMIQNGIIRMADKNSENSPDPISNFVVPQAPDIESRYGLIPVSITGDTIRNFNQRLSPQQYIIPESLDVQDFQFGYRNRGNYTPIESEAASVTAFNNFLPFGKHNKNFKTYIGIDPNGNLKAGDISQFGEGDFLTGTYSNDIASFMKDANGNIVMTKSVANPMQNQPAYILWNNGNLVEKPNGQAVNILVRKDDKIGNQYGNVTGGRVLVRVGNELRLLSGSVQDIDRQFEDMKKRHNANYGTFYTLDNGSFNRGIRTYSGRITSDELREYDALNSSGGNFLYLKPRTRFTSDTVLTPHIRTVNSDSYKKGHALNNSQQGIVLHHTGEYNTYNDIIQDLTIPKGQIIPFRNEPQKREASAHVVIGRNGNRTVLATPDKVTFHAGESAWNGQLNVNDFMIGIEFEGDTNKRDLTSEQIQSAIEYMTPIIRNNNIRLEDITTHQQVRNLWLDYARKAEQSTEGVQTKPDINQRNYAKIIEALKQRLYYER